MTTTLRGLRPVIALVLPLLAAVAAYAQPSSPGRAAFVQPPPAEIAGPPPAPHPTTASPDPALPGTPDIIEPPAPPKPADFSPLGMFLAADIVVKAVLCILAAAVLLTWTIWLAKLLELTLVRRRLRRSLRVLRAAPRLEAAAAALAPGSGVARALVHAAQEEWQHSADLLDDREGLKERIALHLGRVEAATGRRMMHGTGLLATIGATAPFVGLFGTVWGIMNSFIGISRLHSTNLAVVAPGIAEALLATAIGLVAAIPAVVIYNHFARQVGACRAQVADAATMVMRLASRDLSRGAAAPTASRVVAE